MPLDSTNAAVAETALRGAKRVPLTDLPVIDIKPLFGKARRAKEAVASEIDTACREVGFLYIRNHGIPDEATQAAFDEARRFFALSVEEKMKIHVKKVSTLTRGYVPMFEVHADKDAKPDFHEAFESALEVASDDPDHLAGNLLYGPNQWPEGLPGFRETVYGYYEALNRLGRTLFTGFAIALDLPEDYFDDKITKPAAGFRLMHYPLQENLDDTGTWGIGAHTDQECFTLLVQDSASALQLKNAEDQWVEARPVADTIVVNIGDLMQRWTNDRYRSTIHRVLNPVARARYSMGYFFGPNYDTPIACLPSCRDADYPAKYGPVTAGKFCEARVLAYHYET